MRGAKEVVFAFHGVPCFIGDVLHILFYNGIVQYSRYYVWGGGFPGGSVVSPWMQAVYVCTHPCPCFRMGNFGHL